MISERKVTLRSHGKNEDKVARSPQEFEYKKIICHYCRTKDIQKGYTICSNYPECRCGFCDDCLKYVFGIDSSALTRSWICGSCLGVCPCPKCTEKQIIRAELEHDMSFENEPDQSNQKDLDLNENIQKRKSKSRYKKNSGHFRVCDKKSMKSKHRNVIRKYPKRDLPETPNEDSKSNKNNPGTIPMNPSVLFCSKIPIYTYTPYQTPIFPNPQNLGYSSQVIFKPYPLSSQELNSQPYMNPTYITQNQIICPTNDLYFPFNCQSHMNPDHKPHENQKEIAY